MSTISTHVLDTALGRPARRRSRHPPRTRQSAAIGSAVTDDDGRARDFSRNATGAGAIGSASTSRRISRGFGTRVVL